MKSDWDVQSHCQNSRISIPWKFSNQNRSDTLSQETNIRNSNSLVKQLHMNHLITGIDIHSQYDKCKYMLNILRFRVEKGKGKQSVHSH